MSHVNERAHHERNGKTRNGVGRAPPLSAPQPPLPASVDPARATTPSRLTVAEETGRQVMFGVEELLVSKTDLKGHITYANEAFLKVAGFSEAELIGQPHNVIRHPEMPRLIFQMLWKSIQSGKELFAYVVNLTRNGDHYWVLAHVTPTFDEQCNVTGYHSNRRYADPAAVARIKTLYAKLLAEERSNPKRAEAIAASALVLDQYLAELKITYDEFIFSF